MKSSIRGLTDWSTSRVLENEQMKQNGFNSADDYRTFIISGGYKFDVQEHQTNSGQINPSNFGGFEEQFRSLKPWNIVGLKAPKKKKPVTYCDMDFTLENIKKYNECK